MVGVFFCFGCCFGGFGGFFGGFWVILFVCCCFLGFFPEPLGDTGKKKILPAMDNDKFQAWDENLDQL